MYTRATTLGYWLSLLHHTTKNGATSLQTERSSSYWNKRWDSLRRNRTFEFQRNDFRVRRNKSIVMPPMQNAEFTFRAIIFEFYLISTRSSNLETFHAKCNFRVQSPLCLYNIQRNPQAGTASGVARIPALPKHCTGPQGPNGIEKANLHMNGLLWCDAKNVGIFRHGAVFLLQLRSLFQASGNRRGDSLRALLYPLPHICQKHEDKR